METDILSQVLDPGPGEGEAADTSEETDADAGNPSQDGSDEARGLQSRLDTTLNENNELKERLAALESVAPLARYVDRNPHVLDHLDAMTRLDVEMAANQDGEEIPLPEYPVKPKDFDPAEVTDPNTPSGKYWIDLQEYNAQAAQRLLTETQRQARVTEETRTLAAASRKQREEQAAINTRLVSQHGLEANEVQDFWNFVLDPQNLNETNMVAFYRAAKGQKAPANRPPASPESGSQFTPEQAELARQAEAMGLRLTIPESAVAGAGADAGGTPNEQDLFIGSLVNPETDTGLIY